MIHSSGLRAASSRSGSSRDGARPQSPPHAERMKSSRAVEARSNSVPKITGAVRQNASAAQKTGQSGSRWAMGAGRLSSLPKGMRLSPLAGYFRSFANGWRAAGSTGK